jgi:hypothetical protein
MKIPSGIYGRYERKQKVLFYSISEYKKIIHPICIHNSLKIVDEIENFNYRNYHVIHISKGELNVALLCNIYHPFCGTILWSDEIYMPRTFIEFPGKIPTEYSEIPMLTSETLNSYPKENSLECLSKDELKDIKYWEVENLGQIIFNDWD